MKSIAMRPEHGDRLGRRALLSRPAESAAQAWESFALISLILAGVCDRTLRPEIGSGGRSLPGCSASILPGLLQLD